MCFWPAGQVAGAIAAGELASREYAAALLRRIERLNPALNAVVTLDERALDQAAVADEAVARGDDLGPLHGVAMTVKDCFSTAGLRTTTGLEEYQSYTPAEDAEVVRSLRQAGAIVLGKTNLPAMAADVQTHSSLLGLCRNPWHRERTAGGSSGGSAVAVAVGFTPVEVGSDLAGSLRIPAACCGVTSHTPSHGIVPLQGHLPPPPGRLTFPDLAVAGPLARTVDDLELLLSIMAEPEPWDRPAWRLSLPPPRPLRRLAAWYDDPACPVDKQVRAVLDRLVHQLESAGVAVDTEARPAIDLAASHRTFWSLLGPFATGDYTDADVELIAAGELPFPPSLGGEFVAQRQIGWRRANEQRSQLRRAWREFFEDYDAILLPVMPNRVQPNDLRPLGDRRIVVDGEERPYWDQVVWAGLTGVARLPSTVVPVGTDSDGLPIGAAIAGDYLDDLTVLQAARVVADVVGPFPPPDTADP